MASSERKENSMVVELKQQTEILNMTQGHKPQRLEITGLIFNRMLYFLRLLYVFVLCKIVI